MCLGDPIQQDLDTMKRLLDKSLRTLNTLERTYGTEVPEDVRNTAFILHDCFNGMEVMIDDLRKLTNER